MFKCTKCDLGLVFNTQQELQNHQDKFCTGSAYADPAHLDARLAGLKRPDPSQVKRGLGDIKDYLRGNVGIDETLPLTDNASLRAKPGAPVSGGGLYQTEPRTEADMVDMLGREQAEREKDLRAQIQREELNRKYASVDRNDLGQIGQQKRAELEDVQLQADAVRDREKQVADELKRMQADLVSGEQAFVGLNDNAAQRYDEADRGVRQREMQRQQYEMANARATQVAQVKVERERLEQEHQRIMQQLGQVEQQKRVGTGSSRASGRHEGGFRENEAARRLGGALSSASKQRGKGAMLDQEIKERMNQDQQRLNQLRAEAQAFKANPAQLGGGGDFLDRELAKQEQSAYVEQLGRMATDMAQSQSPKKQEVLGDIRRALEHESAGPRAGMPTRASMQANGKNDNKLLAKLDDLESLLVQNAAQKVNQRPPRPAPQQQPPMPMQQVPPPVYGQASFQQQYGLPPPPMPGVQGGYMNASMQPGAPPSDYRGLYPPQPAKDAAHPKYDAGMSQLAHMIQAQEKENQELKQALEQFGKDAGQVQMLEQTIENANKDLLSMKNDLGYTIETAVGVAPVNGQPIPEMYAFRQNELRVDDLDKEEKALMNLQAQEFDQMRLLQHLDKNSDLYEHKLKQFKELSDFRAEAEKDLQVQRLEKLKVDFERDKRDADRSLEQQTWLDNQKRAVLEGKINAPAHVAQPQPQYVPQQQSQYPAGELRESQVYARRQRSKQNLPVAREASNSPEVQIPDHVVQPAEPQGPQLVVQFDMGHNLTKDVKQLKILAMPLNGDKPAGKPDSVGFAQAEPDLVNRDRNKVRFEQRRVFSNVTPGPDSRLFFELQVVDPAQPARFGGAGWTWLELVDKRSGTLRSGCFTLPVYSGEANFQAMLGRQKRPPFAPGVAITVRVGDPQQAFFRDPIEPYMNLEKFIVPREHADGRKQLLNLAPAQVPRQQSLLKQPSVAAAPTLADQRQPSAVQPNNVLSKGPDGFVGGGAEYDENYENAGINLQLHFLQQKINFQKTTVKVSARLGDGKQTVAMQDGSDCVKQVPSVPDDESMPLPPGSVIKVAGPRGELSAVPEAQKGQDRRANYGESAGGGGMVIRNLRGFTVPWAHDFYNQFWAGQGQVPVTLLFEVFGKQGSKRELKAFAVFDLCGSDGKPRFGYHTAALNKPPFKSFSQPMQPLPGEYIGFTIMDPSQPASPGVPKSQGRVATSAAAGSALAKSLASGPENQREEKASSLLESEIPGTPQTVSTQFYNLDRTQYDANEVFNPENDALDIYIDSTRHLPDNVSITKCTVRVVDSLLKDVAKPMIVLPQPSVSTLRSQVYDIKFELRFEKEFKSTAMVYLKFETFDRSAKAARLLGTSYFPLFLSQSDQMPVDKEMKAGIVGHIGNYQMPIFSDLPKQTAPFNYEKFLYLQRIPTASILLRVVPAPRGDDGKPLTTSNLPVEQQYYNHAGSYKDQTYNTNYFPATADEQQIMRLRRRRLDPPLQTVIAGMLTMMSSSSSDATELTGKARYDFIVKNVSVPKNMPPKLDLNFFSQYEPGLGFRVSVEAVHDVKIQAPLTVLANVIPPGSFFDPSRDINEPPKDAFIFSELNLKSKYVSQVFNEGDAVVLGFAPDQPGMSLLLTVYAYEPAKKDYQPYGFAVMPILHEMEVDDDIETYEYFVGSGMYSVPLFKGMPSPALVTELMESHKPLDLINSKLALGQVKYQDTTSVIVRCVDTQRKGHFLDSLPKMRPSARYLTEAQKKTHSYKPVEEGFFSSYATLASLLPSNMQDPVVANQIMEDTFKAKLNIA